MRTSMMLGLAVGVVAGALLATNNIQVSNAVEKGKCSFEQKMQKLKKILQ